MVKNIQEGLKFFKADIFRVFSFTAISTVVKMLTGLISVKIVATIIGPGGIALLGQLNNFATVIMIVASAGINNGVTKYVAEFRNSTEDIKRLLSTALKITLACAVLCGVFMSAFNEYLAQNIMLDAEYGYIFIVFGLTILLYALNGLIASILNGYKEFKLFVNVSIIGSLVGLAFTLILVFFWQLKGALISAVTFQSIMFFISLWKVRKLQWLNLEFFNRKIDKISLHRYVKYSLMTLVTATTAPVAQLVLRGYVISNISLQEAGWWEGMNRVSNMYLMVITSSFSVYYLPRLAEITEDTEMRNEVLKAFKIIVPSLLVAFVAIYLCRSLMIKVLFTTDFIGMKNLFFWQLVGDFFKICSWLLAYLMIAKAMTKAFIFSEIFFSTLFLALAYILMGYKGIVGITEAYAITYFMYLLGMTILFRKLIFKKR